MAREIAVVVRRVQEAHPAIPPVGVGQEREAGEMRTAATREIDVRAASPRGGESPPADVVANRAQHGAQRDVGSGPEGRQDGQSSGSHVPVRCYQAMPWSWP